MKLLCLFTLVWGALVNLSAHGLSRIDEGRSSHVKTIDDILSIAYKKNPTIQAAANLAEAEDSLITSVIFPDDPVLGISTLNRGTMTRYGTISQKIEFPVKYFIKGKAQNSRARSAKSSLENEKLLIRQKIISTYFSIYSVAKIISLTKFNMRAVREFARVAERKYAAGKASQSDSMKAHLEITQLELDLIRLEREKKGLSSKLRSLVGDPELLLGDVGELHYDIPQFDESKINQLSELAVSDSPKVRVEKEKLNEVEWKNVLTKWEFAPDIEFRFQGQISGQPSDSKIYSVGLSFPIWFWGKSSSSSASGFRVLSQESRVQEERLRIRAKIDELTAEVVAGQRSLKIFETSLLPQAQGAYHSTRSAYKATGRSFLDLLDSERTFYRVKTSFYHIFREYMNAYTELEVYLGKKILKIENLRRVKNENF